MAARMRMGRRFGRAFTLVEMLIAMALTLILVYAIAEFYAYVGDSVKDGRAMIVISGELRGVSQRLRSDLDQRTALVKSWTDDGAALGYFEYIEGPASDIDADANLALDFTPDNNGNGIPDFEDTWGATNLMGDTDDILAFTIRSDGVPLRGRLGGSTTTSNVAEVIWFTTFNDENGDGIWTPNEPRQLCRRQLLVRPVAGAIGTYPDLNTARTALAAYWQNNDISASVRPETSGQFTIRTNTLADLARRENRFAHQPRSGVNADANFPNVMLVNVNNAASLSTYTLQGNSLGEDVVLANLLAFDVRAYDPSAPLKDDDQVLANARNVLQPGDPGWGTVAADTNYPIRGYGAYVDLFYSRYVGAGPTSDFSGAPAALSYLTNVPTYDTWALSYERDGIDQRGDGSFDRATNGLDDDGANGVDDPGERETSPPYGVPLRGIEVRIRVYEPSTRQARQATVMTDFLPE